ncbi:non-ribosomal peptide synthetase [Sorangium cellulosum]|uniref:Non-ribosomal peptide synthetase n=1 Tax=Sorangium cellulosum TaxID=56 RepID=A0A150QFK4_SORCE|nr:non-ribosomal peptide synthetase [Sorangium cellulosum]KYF66720.1 non-ribosomal peptide synthetase [Sorangium cellulosum]
MTTQVTEPGTSVQGVRLSPEQRRLWALHRSGTAVLTRGLIRLEGALDPARLAGALGEVVARHEILRTAFRRDPRLKFPLQAACGAPPAWRRVDLGGRAAGEQQAHVEALWREAARLEVDLDRGPLLHVWLVRRADRLHDLLVAAPALCADAATLDLLFGELAEAYAGAGDRRERAEEPLQYAQFSEWQNELVGSAEIAPPPAGVPVVLPFEGAAGEGGARGEVVEIEVDAALLGRLESLARGEGASLSSVLLAAFQVHLARLTGSRELVVAVASAGRRIEDVQEVMGPVAKWFPVPCRVDDAARFAELVLRAQAGVEEATEEEERWNPDLPADRGGTCGTVGFELSSLQEPRVAGGLAWRVERRCTGAGGLKLALSAQRGPGGLRLSFWHDARRFGAEGVQGMAEQYRALLGSAADAWSAPAARLGLLGPAERARRLSEGRGAGGVANDAAPPPYLHAAFEEHAARQPDALAVVAGDRRLTYGELNRQANRLAHHLRRRGVGGGSPVGLCGERSVDVIAGLLGILKAGGAYVPLDPHAPVQRLAQQIRRAGLSVLLTGAAVRARLPDLSDTECAVLCLDDAALLDGEPAGDPAVPVLPDDIASVVFTSGSTGEPKGVGVTHRGIAGYTRSVCEALGIEPGLHFATVSTLSADLGNTSIFGALATGGCLHVIGYETATDGRLFSEYYRRWPIDVLKIVPSHLSALLDTGEGAAVLPRRLLVLGGEALPLALVERIAALSSGCAVANHYGPTETTVGALVQPLRALRDRRGCASVPIGRPLTSAEAYVLDERLEPAPAGTVGELYLGGAGLARGYLGQPDLTAERFVPHPFGEGARLYRTGDRARYRPDGAIEFMGRRDHQVKIRGYRVELGEIEARVREHPGVGQAVVVIAAREDGAVGPRIVAYVVPREGALDEASLRAFLRDRLPEYMHPSDLVLLRALPLTANGKVDRRALPSPAARRRREYVAPRTPVEEALAAIWADVLGRPQVGVEDDFFELGGHSLMAIPLMHRIQQALGGSLSLMAIFEAPTVAGLARLLAAERPASSVVVLRAGGARPPLFCVDSSGLHVMAYRGLAAAMSEEQPVLGLDLGPSLARDAGALSLPRIVEQLSREIRERQARGPYHLLGWSVGGVLALAIARALEEQGERVAFLGLLDAQPRARLYAAGEPDVVEELAAYIDQDRSAALLALPPAELDALRERLKGLGDGDRVAEAVRWAQARGFASSDIPPAAYHHRYALLRGAALLAKDLPPRCVAAPIHVWWSADTIARHGGPPVDWQRYTAGAAHTAILPGDHIDAVQGAGTHVRVRETLEVLDPAERARERAERTTLTRESP